VFAVRAHLLEMSGDYEDAVKHYQEAASRTANLAERNYLTLRAAEARSSQSRPAD
jgi:predicted RNA polymerase sigma factor